MITTHLHALVSSDVTRNTTNSGLNTGLRYHIFLHKFDPSNYLASFYLIIIIENSPQIFSEGLLCVYAE